MDSLPARFLKDGAVVIVRLLSYSINLSLHTIKISEDRDEKNHIPSGNQFLSQLVRQAKSYPIVKPCVLYLTVVL